MSTPIAMITEYDIPELFQVHFGDFPDDYFCEQKAREIQAEFRTRMDQISETIKTRNLTRQPKYEYLLPERVPYSLAV